ncbi:type II toxin-antitoxin system ParD family antitoxin [Porticoccus sp. GXU_MW_L64]
MANTSLSLGPHWETFIKSEVSSGRYGSASEVVRDALRNLEERKTKLEALRAHLLEGARQADAGEYVDQSLEGMLAEFKDEFRDQAI